MSPAAEFVGEKCPGERDPDSMALLPRGMGVTMGVEVGVET